MLITRRSPLTGVENTLDLDVTEEQMAELSLPIQQRRLIQEIVPHLSMQEREFLKTGYTPEDWRAMFPPGT